MLASFSAFPLLRTTFAAVALAAAVVSPGHAVARNHDLQRIQIPSMPAAVHDRASGPSLRRPI